MSVQEKHVQKKLRLTQVCQNLMFHGSAHPKETSQQYTTSANTEALHHQEVLLEIVHPWLWPWKVPGWTLGMGWSPSPSDAGTPNHAARNTWRWLGWQWWSKWCRVVVQSFRLWLLVWLIVTWRLSSRGRLRTRQTWKDHRVSSAVYGIQLVTCGWTWHFIKQFRWRWDCNIQRVRHHSLNIQYLLGVEVFQVTQNGLVWFIVV